MLFGTYANGWTTHQNFQTRAPCVFGCARGEDCLRHWALCPTIANFGRIKLCVPHINLDQFLALQPRLTSDTASELARRAICFFVVHSAMVARRHGGTSSAAEALAKYAREACAAHPRPAARARAVWLS